MVLPRLKTDLLDIIDAVIDERLDELSIQWSQEACACVVMASGGYPGSYPKGIEITGLDENGQADGAIVYHAGTAYQDGKFFTNGGRVLGVTALGDTLDEALNKAYDAVKTIRFDGAHYRTDIGLHRHEIIVAGEAFRKECLFVWLVHRQRRLMQPL